MHSKAFSHTEQYNPDICKIAEIAFSGCGIGIHPRPSLPTACAAQDNPAVTLNQPTILVSISSCNMLYLFYAALTNQKLFHVRSDSFSYKNSKSCKRKWKGWCRSAWSIKGSWHFPHSVTSVLNAEHWKALSVFASYFKCACVLSFQHSIICQATHSE